MQQNDQQLQRLKADVGSKVAQAMLLLWYIKFIKNPNQI